MYIMIKLKYFLSILDNLTTFICKCQMVTLLKPGGLKP